MKYKYPKISNILSFERLSDDAVRVTEHLNDQSLVLDIETVRFIRRLDGFTNPYEISTVLSHAEIDDALETIEEFGFSRKSGVLRESFGTFLKTLWIPKRTLALNVAAYFINLFLLISWLPMLIVGLYMIFNNTKELNFTLLLWGSFLGLISGMFLHETGHAFAGIAYKAQVFEMGVMLKSFVIPGAYVLLDTDKVKKRIHRIQINAAGVEANFWLTGLFLILASVLPHLGGMFVAAAFWNLFLGLLNLTFIDGLDGTFIISEVFGVKNIVCDAKDIIFDKSERKEVLSRGAEGYATVTVCYIMFVLQTALPILIISNIFEVISWFG